MTNDTLPPVASASLSASPGVDRGLDELKLLGDRAGAGKELSEEEILDVGKKFESLLLHQLLATMRKSVPKSNLFGESSAHNIYQDMFDERIAESVVETGQTGIGKAITEEIIRQQQSSAVPKDGAPYRSLSSKPSQLKPLGENEELQPLERKEPESGPVDRKEPRFGRIFVGEPNKSPGLVN
jgi:Rod binding domain-containing protein